MLSQGWSLSPSNTFVAIKRVRPVDVLETHGLERIFLVSLVLGCFVQNRV